MHDEYYFINQDGEKSSDFHIFFEEYPHITLGQEKHEKKTVPGKGNVYYKTKTFSDTEIEMLLDVNTTGYGIGRMDACAEARNFLHRCRIISFCDEPEYFYKVKYTELGKVEQYTEVAGDFDVLFICEPGVYLKSGMMEYDMESVLYNHYGECHPEYYITGEGVCELSVNGKSMTVNATQTIVINTDLMIAYRIDGTMQNAAVSGDYADLYLKHGENTISITEGFEVKIMPNWRYL